MFEIAVASVFIAVAFVAVGTSSHSAASLPVTELQPVLEKEEPLADLPCPWCLAQTHEDDSGCPSCGQPFG
jgi:hypothetical protein